jgi:hypothetical protein
MENTTAVMFQNIKEGNIEKVKQQLEGGCCDLSVCDENNKNVLMALMETGPSKEWFDVVKLMKPLVCGPLDDSESNMDILYALVYNHGAPELIKLFPIPDVIDDAQQVLLPALFDKKIHIVDMNDDGIMRVNQLYEELVAVLELKKRVAEGFYVAHGVWLQAYKAGFNGISVSLLRLNEPVQCALKQLNEAKNKAALSVLLVELLTTIHDEEPPVKRQRR